MEKTKKFNFKDFMINYGVIVVMFILVIYTGLTSKNFFTMNNFANILANMSYRVVIALGIAGSGGALGMTALLRTGTTVVGYIGIPVLVIPAFTWVRAKLGEK